MDDAIPQKLEWLKQKYLKKWYSWNSNHPDVVPIPIGLNEDSQLKPIEQARPVTPKIELALANFKQDRAVRVSLFNKVKYLPFVHVETYAKKWQSPQDLAAHYESISKYKWTLCPRGAGEDTHRLWEALYLGSIPVVLKSSISALYDGLPVIQLNNWDELSLELLRERSKTLSNSRSNAYFKHWENLIRSSQDQRDDKAQLIQSEDDDKDDSFKTLCNTLKKLLSLVDDVATKHELWYSVSHGTLLAATRNQDCIVDIDMDIVVRQSEVKLWQKNFIYGTVLEYGLQKAPLLADGSANKDPWYKGKGSDGRIPLRLMAVDANGTICSQPHIDFHIASGSSMKKEGPRVRCNFGSVQTWCFEDSHKRLSERYGTDWNVPKTSIL